MLCPKCQGKTKVLDTRSPANSTESAWAKKMLDHGQRLIGWWSNDYRVRKRKCTHCYLKFLTIEIATMDLEDAFDEAKHGDDFGAPWKVVC